jgi:hypothetical protein
MGDKEGARTQFDLVLSGKPLEVNAAGRKVRPLAAAVTDRLIALLPPFTQGKYSLEVRCHPSDTVLDASMSLLLTGRFRMTCICAPMQRSRHWRRINDFKTSPRWCHVLTSPSRTSRIPFRYMTPFSDKHINQYMYQFACIPVMTLSNCLGI